MKHHAQLHSDLEQQRRHPILQRVEAALHGGDDHAGQIGPVLCAGQIPTIKQDRFFNEFAGAFAVVRLIIFRYFVLCRRVDPQRDTNLFLFQNVHLQTLGFAGALRAAGVPVIGKCPMQVYLKRKSSKCANRLNAVRIAGCCGSAGGVCSHPPLSCNQIAGECQPIRRHIRLGTRPRKAACFTAFSLWRVSSRFSAESSTRGHTGAYGRGFGLCGTFPSNRAKQLSV